MSVSLLITISIALLLQVTLLIYWLHHMARQEQQVQLNRDIAQFIEEYQQQDGDDNIAAYQADEQAKRLNRANCAPITQIRRNTHATL